MMNQTIWLVKFDLYTYVKDKNFVRFNFMDKQIFLFKVPSSPKVIGYGDAINDNQNIINLVLHIVCCNS